MNRVDTPETLEGVVSKVVFHNPSNGWTVLRLEPVGFSLPHTVVGSFQRVSPGENLRFQGRFIVDPKHGRQFEAATCLSLSPATLRGVEKFLGSGLIPGIGPVMAGRIVERFGMESIDVIEKDPRKLSKVQGIGPKRAKAISKALVTQKGVRDVMIFLESCGISPAFAHRIQKCYGDDAIRRVSENPFKLASDVRGIGFRSADKIAAKLGIPLDSPNRIEAGALFALEGLAKDGHVFAYQENLVEYAKELLGVEIDQLERAIDRLALMGRIFKEGSGPSQAVYLPNLYRAEKLCAKRLAELLGIKRDPLPINPQKEIEVSEANFGITYAPKQRQAFEALKHSQVMVLTGGPGTGKTTLLLGLTACLERAKQSVSLAAPTGRAAKRVSESTRRDARTLHRLLEFSPKTSKFERDANNPLDADVVIVDEVSMVDIELFAALLVALKPTARLLLVGDPDQLPSVGPGTVIGDMVALGQLFPKQLAKVHLNEIFRQAQKSLIVVGAHDILAGYEPRAGSKGSDDDLFIIEREEPAACLEVIKELVESRIPSRFGFDPIDDVQVLCPMHKGVLGAANLNLELQALLNSKGLEKDAGPGGFRIGDKVMQVRNNYDLEVFNGDIGKVTLIHEKLEFVEVTFMDRTVRYPSSEMDQLTLAYAISVHKSQGSEYPAVVIPVHTQHFVMLRRNLLYTAVTRGKKLVVLVGTKRAIGIAVRTNTLNERCTGFVKRVREILV